MSNGKSNVRMLMGLCLLVGIMFGAALVLILSTSTVTPNDAHVALANSVTVHDDTLNKVYTAVCVSTDYTVPLQMIPLEFSGAIEYSMWEFRSNPDEPATVYAVMSIYGPGSEGEHFIQIGRLTTNGLTVTYPDGPTGGHIWEAGGNDGYVYAIV